MVAKSHGPRRRTRKKFRKTERANINKFLKKFKIGDRVAINIESSSSAGMPFRRFQGLAGEVVEKRGKAYIVKIKDGGKFKKIIANPEHLKQL